MGKDWFIWFGCVLLFGAGAIWGGCKIPTGFFAIQSLHDLSETIGGFATVAAVLVAVFGISSWKSQKIAAENHDLAKRLALSLGKYKFLVIGSWSYVGTVVSEVKSSGSSLVIDNGASYRNLIRIERDSTLLARAEISSIALECAAIWGKSYEMKFNKLFMFEGACTRCISMYLLWGSGGLDEDEKKSISRGVIACGGRVNGFYVGDYDGAAEYIERIASDIDIAIKERLLS